MRFATGDYAGDGTGPDRLISTGLSGELRYVRVVDFDNAREWARAEAFGSNQALLIETGSVSIVTGLDWPGGGDFTVGGPPDDGPNVAGVGYVWVAWSE